MINSVVELHWIITHDWIIVEAPLAFDEADLESAVTDASPLDIDGLPWRILNFLAFILNLAGHFVALALFEILSSDEIILHHVHNLLAHHN